MDSSLWRSNFIPSVPNSIIIIGSEFVNLYLRFTYKRWVGVFYQKSEFNFLGANICKVCFRIESKM